MEMVEQREILLVGNEEDYAEMIRCAFASRSMPVQLSVAEDLSQAQQQIAGARPDLVITDMHLPDGKGLDLLPADRSQRRFPVIVMASCGTDQTAVEAMRAGAMDCVSKSGATIADMPHIAERALREWTLIAEARQLQQQLLRSEKMAAIGQLAAGVAHEINNPVGYISSNISTLVRYLERLFEVLDAYKGVESQLSAEACEQIRGVKERVKLDYLREDVMDLIAESNEGVARVKQIVQDLKDFSHRDEAEWQGADLIKGLESTLNIVNNEIKYKADVVREYAPLPEVKCIPSQLNQVFMNLLVNAAHAINDYGTITVRTGQENADWVWVEVEDSGQGISPELKKSIFDPFFTTKPVGQGTGLGLSVSYGIVKTHNGRIEVDSEVGRGSRFRVWLPVKQKEPEDCREKTKVPEHDWQR